MAEEGWVKITSKTQQNKKTTLPTRHFWSGFDEKGEQRWFLELNNGEILSKQHRDYKQWLRKLREMETAKR